MTDNAAKTYDGEALTAGGNISGFIGGETATLKTTGKQIVGGESDNTYTINWNGTAQKSDYTVKATLGKLTVNESTDEILVTVSNEQVIYDGKAHHARVEVTNLPKGYSVAEAKASATATHVSDGIVKATCDTLVIENVKGQDVTAKLNIKKVDGTIEILPATVTITTEDAAKIYDGQPLTAAGTVEGLVEGETVGFATTGSQTLVGASDNTYNLLWGNIFNSNTADKDDYEVKEDIGTLTVNPVPAVQDGQNGGNSGGNGNQATPVMANPPGPLGPGMAMVQSLLSPDEEVPLAGTHQHGTCCILHILIMLAALIIMIEYVTKMRKRQNEIHELKEQIMGRRI